jgi:hypothetical protein
MRNMIFNLLYRGAQWHHQRSFTNPLSDYLKYGSNGEPNIKYNLVGDIKMEKSTHSQETSTTNR